MPNARQSDLPNRPTYLPPLSPSARSHPHHHLGVPALQSFPVKLSSDIVNALINGEEGVLEFTQDEQGKIYIPARSDVTFTTRSITDHNADTSRAALFSRRASNLRLVGPIKHEMEIDRFPNQRSHVVKKRAVNSRPATKRELKPADSSQEPPAPKSRARKPVEKRPRAPARRPTSNGPSSNTTSAFRIPRSVPAPLAPSLRSAPASPTENGRHSGAKPPTTTARNSIGALGARRISPPSNTQLPRPVSRQTPTKTRQSPHSSSRGPSPNVHSPSSPRVGARAKMDDPEDVRRHVVHSLALGDMTMDAILRRHEACNMESTVLDGALGEVAERTGKTYRLKKRSWREVYDDYTDYSDMEKKRMSQNRFKVGAVDGKLGTEVMNDDLLDHEVNDLTKLMNKSVPESRDDDDDDKLRKNYAQAYQLYSEVIERVTDVGTKFRRLEDRWVSCGEAERTHVGTMIQSAHKVHAERFSRFKRVLPKIHGYLKQVRQAVDRYDQWEE